MERNYRYFLDKEGHIWHAGTEITDPRFAFTIHRFLEKTTDGQLLAKCQGENCYIDAEDAPYVVQDVAFHKGSGRQLRQVDLIFAGGYMEILDPSTLHVSPQNVLYCRVRKGEFAARFTRKSYFQLAPFIHEDENHRFYIELNDRRYPIAEQATSV